MTVTAPDRATVIERSELTRWAGLVNGERGTGGPDPLAWFEGEARELGIVVTASRCATGCGAEGDATPRGLTRQDFADYMRGLLATEAILERITTAAAQSVTQAQIDAYVQAHPRTEPEQTDASGRASRRATATRDGPRRRSSAAPRGAPSRSATRSPGGQDGLQPTGHARRSSRRPTRPHGVRGAQGRAARPDQDADSATTWSRSSRSMPARPTPLKTQRAAAWEILASEAQQRALAAYEAGAHGEMAPAHDLRAGLAAHRGLRQPPNRQRSRTPLTQRTGPKTRTSAELRPAPVARGSGRAYGRLSTTFAGARSPVGEVRGADV